jgi:hypothetical protein
MYVYLFMCRRVWAGDSVFTSSAGHFIQSDMKSPLEPEARDETLWV